MRTRQGARGGTPSQSKRELRLVSSLSVYGAYHSSFWNRVVHCIFVPAIWWSAALALHATGPLEGAVGVNLPGKVSVTGATLFWAFCAAVYVYLETPVGILAALFYFLLHEHTSQLYAARGQSVALQIALAVHLVSWFAQVVVGHALIEKRRPALVDSLFASLILAPLFVVLEIAFGLGYRPALHAKLLAQTQRELGKLRARDIK